MIIDLRYHVTTLISVFLALGIGVLIGMSINSDGQLLQKQASLIDAIDTQLHALRGEKEQLTATVQQLRQELAVYHSFAVRLTAQNVTDRLYGQSIGLVNVGSDVLAQQVEEILTTAGARVICHIRIAEPQILVGVETAAADSPAYAVLTGLMAGLGGTAADLGRAVQWVKQGGAMPEQVVVVGSIEVGDALRSLVTALARQKAPVVAAVPDSDLRPFRMVGVKAVADVSTPMGQMALVEMLERMR